MLPKSSKELVQLQQSDKTLYRGKKDKKQAVYSKCSLCKRDNVLIDKVKHSLCGMCFNWCRKYLIKYKGFYNETFIHEALLAFQKPIPCRFHDVCGNFVPRVVSGKIRPNRRAICPRCSHIYDAGVNDARTKQKRKGKTPIGH